MSYEKPQVLEVIAKINTTSGDRESYIKVQKLRGQFGDYFSIERHGIGMHSKYLPLPLNADALRELGNKMIEFANNMEKK